MSIAKVKRILSLSALAAAATCALAVPPKPGIIDIHQPDGSSFKATIKGDASFHWYETPEGEILAADMADGFFRAVDASRLSQLKEEAAMKAAASLEQARINGMSRVAPSPIKREFPTTGTVRGLIVLAEFQDVKFQEGSTAEYFDRKVNSPDYSAPETYGSVNDFFKAQSKGVFTPEFDIVGPITLPRNCADYGLYEDLDALFRDSAKAAQEAGTDFSRYDVNEDYFVDFLFVIYAGHGEAQGGPAETIWPAKKDISDFVFDSFDGMYLGNAACSCELKGGSGTEMDGVATICHEFSHILGLPDIYDPQGTGGYGMGHYDMMCYGPYNDDGRTPCNYTAMEKFTLGWIEPTVLESETKDFTLHNFGDTDECVFIVNPENPNEYFTLENRQQVGFDSGLPGHGLVISYCHYNRGIWAKNSPNSPMIATYEHVNIIPADNSRLMGESEAGDTWPGTAGKTEFSYAATSDATWRSTGKPMEMPVSNIRENADGSITFDFMAANAVGGIEAASEEDAEYFTLSGMKVNPESLLPGIYIRKANGKASRIAIH